MKPMLAFALMLVHDHAVAEELVQEAFANVWASPRTPSAQPEFRRWLYRTIANLATDHHRRRSRWNRLRLFGPPPPDPQDEVERRAEDAALAAALKELSVRERQAVYLRYFEDHPFAETARIMGTREGAARLVVHRALAKLRRQLGDRINAAEVRA